MLGAVRGFWTRTRPEGARQTRAVLRLVLAGIGCVYVIAFLSLLVQVRGLVGSHGILPNERYFTALSRYTDAGFADAPSLCWGAGCSDATLLALCGIGAVAGLLLAIGCVPLPAAVVAFFAYLSLFHAGQVFLSFQWDLLLLEAGFLAILAAPPGALGPRSAAWDASSTLPVWLFRWLLFRLVFASGVVKLSSGDPTWRNLTALAFHYETQPLPWWTSWWAYQLPRGIQRASTAAALSIELVAPWLGLGPRRLRQVGAAAIASLMGLIAATGSYGFFNLLTLVLCLSLLDDDALPAWLRRLATGEGSVQPLSHARRGVQGIAAALVVAMSLAPLLSCFRTFPRWLVPLAEISDWQRGFCIANSYGLFATMTTERPEIRVEGSDDGQHWRAYAFPFKPGDPKRVPRFAGPYMPRLDWQLWFAALRGPERTPWFRDFVVRLLENEPSVRALLANDPFPDAPPRQIRVSVSRYRFTDLATRRETGAWWSVGPARVVLETARRDEDERAAP